MYKKVLQQLALTDEHLLLDAGCGSGLFLKEDLETLPFGDDSFDVVIGGRKDRRLLREQRNVRWV